MANFFLFIIISVIVFILGIFILSGTFIRKILKSFSKQSVDDAFRSGMYNQGYGQEQHNQTHNASEHHKKVFSKEEGEYIDYEEIKSEQ